MRAAASFGVLSAATRAGLAAENARSDGRLNQSVCKWCYRNMDLEALCEHAAGMGIVSVELLDKEQWPTVAKYGLTCAVGRGICNIPERNQPHREPREHRGERPRADCRCQPRAACPA